MVARTTRSVSDASIIATLEPVSAASISVCPGKCQPAAWSVPAALLTMVLVSRLTRDRVPAHADRFMVRLHTPEALVLDRG